MASRVTGSPLATLNRTELAFDPRYGDRLRQTYQGPKNAITILYSTFRSIGLRATTTHRGPLWECTVDVGYDDTAGYGETPVDH